MSCRDHMVDVFVWSHMVTDTCIPALLNACVSTALFITPFADHTLSGDFANWE